MTSKTAAVGFTFALLGSLCWLYAWEMSAVTIYQHGDIDPYHAKI